MTRLQARAAILYVVLSVVLPVGLQAQTTPEWLTDLRIVATASGAPKAHFIALENDNKVSMSVADITTLARQFKTTEALEEALGHLPTEERRDRARKTLTPFTAWGMPACPAPCVDSHTKH